MIKSKWLLDRNKCKNNHKSTILDLLLTSSTWWPEWCASSGSSHTKTRSILMDSPRSKASFNLVAADRFLLSVLTGICKQFNFQTKINPLDTWAFYYFLLLATISLYTSSQPLDAMNKPDDYCLCCIDINILSVSETFLRVFRHFQ